MDHESKLNSIFWLMKMMLYEVLRELSMNPARVIILVLSTLVPVLRNVNVQQTFVKDWKQKKEREKKLTDAKPPKSVSNS